MGCARRPPASAARPAAVSRHRKAEITATVERLLAETRNTNDDSDSPGPGMGANETLCYTEGSICPCALSAERAFTDALLLKTASYETKSQVPIPGGPRFRGAF